MSDFITQKAELLEFIGRLNSKYELSKNVDEFYFEPGMMENLDQYLGKYDEQSNVAVLRTELKGLRYENRTVNLDDISVGDTVKIIREQSNIYNSNNFTVVTLKNKSLGNLPAELCNSIAPLYDSGHAVIESPLVTYIEKISQRSRYAKQGVLFIEFKIKFRGI